MRKFAANQKFRVIVDHVSFYANAKQIRAGVGDFTQINLATAYALQCLENIRNDGSVTGPATCGLACNYNDVNVQLNVA